MIRHFEARLQAESRNPESRSVAMQFRALLEAGGDFADGVIAFEGSLLGADSILSFDRQAARLVETNVGSARLLY
jgi:predicted nucleic-acid-binding protein